MFGAGSSRFDHDRSNRRGRHKYLATIHTSPIATTLLMAAVLLAGGIAYYQLPVAALPEVEYPTVQIVTFYPGANPDVMASSVTAPLERQFGQVAGPEGRSS